MAQSRCRLRGEGEKILSDALISRGYTVDEQAPIDIYNIDILVGHIAVEPRCDGRNPMKTPRYRQRTKHIACLGYTTLWILYKDVAALLGCLNEIISHLKEMSLNPPGIGQHRVIRCAAHRYARVRNDLGQFAAIPMPVRFICTRKE